MRKSLMALILTTVLLVCAVSVAAEMAKEETGAGTNVYTATMTVLPLDKDRYALTYEALGVNTSDNGKGPFHNMSTRNIGVIYFDKGVGKLLGYIVMTAPDGDKILAEITEDKTLPPPNPNRGTGKYIGGTGKFSGIEGTIEYTRYYVQPAKKGTAQAVSHSKSTWKLPGAKK
jgi:hypothetical protein